MKRAFVAAALLLASGCENDPTSTGPQILVRVENVGTVDLPNATLFLRDSLMFGPVPAGAVTDYVRTRGAFALVHVRVRTPEYDYLGGYIIDYIGDTPYQEGSYTGKVTVKPQSRSVSIDLVRD